MQDEMNDYVNPYYKDPDSFVSVVRCKDCIRFAELIPGTGPICTKFGISHGMLPTDFCSYGVRKE